MTNSGSVAMTTVMLNGIKQLLHIYSVVIYVLLGDSTVKPHLLQGHLLRHLCLGSITQCVYLFHAG